MSTGTETREPSQLYLKVPRERQWRAQGLRAVLPTLITRWKRHEQKPEWEWVVMPGGAVVAYRERADKNGRGELRIARAEPLDPEKREKWEHEVRTFCRAWAITPTSAGDSPCFGEEWLWQDPHAKDEGKTAARLLELRRGEIRPRIAVCWDCLEKTGELVEVQWFPAGPRGQRCTQHAIEAGQQYDGEEVPA